MLAIDTSSDACSVALQVDDSTSSAHVVEPRAHTRILVPMIEQLMADSWITLSDLEAIVLGNGPGSFIGMRIGASVAQGLAFGGGLRLVPVSSLAAIAAQVFAERDASRVLVAQDAHMHEVYLAEFVRGADGLPNAQGNVRLHRASEPLHRHDETRILAAGAGWKRYPVLVAANPTAVQEIDEPRHPDARYLLGLGAREWRNGVAIAPERLEPAYVRTEVAAVPGWRGPAAGAAPRRGK